MYRAERLLEPMQTLRRRRYPVGGAALADNLGISLRTPYLDIASPRAQGPCIDGAPGMDYVLRPGFMLPPPMFSAHELDALALGSRRVAAQADSALGAAARDAIAKVAAVPPTALRHELDSSALPVGSAGPPPADDPASARIHEAIRGERKLGIGYRDLQGNDSARTVCPFVLDYFDRVRVVAARYGPQASRRRTVPDPGAAMSDPNSISLCIDSPQVSAASCADPLGRAAVEASPTFAMFALDSDVVLGPWSRHTVEPAATAAGLPWPADIAALFVRTPVKKGRPLLAQSECRRHALWIETGAMRLFLVRRDGREFNKNFYADGALVCPLTPAM